MNNLAETVAAYRAMGLSCSQTLMSVVGLDARGEESEELVAAMGGLSYGMHCQHTCGALTGAACSLALHDASRETLAAWCGELSSWFEERFGSVSCEELLGKGEKNPTLCMEIIRETAKKSLEILEGAGCL